MHDSTMPWLQRQINGRHRWIWPRMKEITFVRRRILYTAAHRLLIAYFIQRLLRIVTTIFFLFIYIYYYGIWIIFRATTSCYFLLNNRGSLHFLSRSVTAQFLAHRCIHYATEPPKTSGKTIKLYNLPENCISENILMHVLFVLNSVIATGDLISLGASFLLRAGHWRFVCFSFFCFIFFSGYVC